MTRKAYMEELERELGGFDEASRRDILLEIEDHIDELAEKHTEMGEEELVTSLESPGKLAASLRQEAGIPDGSEQAASKKADGEIKLNVKVEADSDSEGRTEAGNRPRRSKSRITIDGQDLDDVIRRALSAANIFKGSTVYEEKFQKEDAGSGTTGKRVVVKDLHVDKVKRIVVKTRSADLKVYLSAGGFSATAEGGEDSGITMHNEDGKVLTVSSVGKEAELESVELWVPASVDLLVLKTIAGDIEVVDRLGDLELETVSGDVEVHACSGSVSAKTASGDLALTCCSEKLDLLTSSGDVLVELDASCDGARIETVSGDIELRYPDDLDASFRWSTVSGDVDCDAEVVGSRAAKVGAGLVLVQVGSVSGSIQISSL
ncbi:MAG: DUF4097 family beta strand repeat-containing protein [Spirochaetes bacterium]|nr:DUF4097 family beta strand repeat-containing protein [Spirochaetota bacterium]